MQEWDTKVNYTITPYHVAKNVTLKGCPHNANLDNWRFNCSVECPSFKVKRLRQGRKVVTLDCTEQNLGIIDGVSLNSSEVFTIEFLDPCLAKVLTKRCVDSFLVPNIIHYVWFGDGTRNMSFYQFVSVLSIHVFIQPCLILYHGNTLPKGDYWHMILHIVPNIIHVRREPPNIIFNNTIKKVEHKSDVARIEILKGELVHNYTTIRYITPH